MTRAVLSLGANLGDRAGALRTALTALKDDGVLVARSTLYETPPWGPVEQPPYLNAIAIVRGPQDAAGWLARAHELEDAAGRTREVRWGARTLDVDVVTVTGDDGRPVVTGDNCTPEAIPAGVANTLANMMIGVVTSGTGRRAQIPGHDIAGKTGTTQDNKTAAFGGITPKYAVSVMYFDPLGKVLVGGEGGGVPATIFHDAMAPVLADQPNTPFTPSDPAVEAGNKGSGYAPPAPAPAPSPTPSDQPPADQPAEPGDGEGNPGNGGEPGNGGNPGNGN